MKNPEKFKFIIFDLDGVIFDSKKNMEKSWNDVCKKHNINVKFENYFDKIGVPFEKILINLGLNPDKTFFKTFQQASLKNINLIQPYPWVIKQFKFLQQKKIKFSILTSKDLKRSKYLLNKYKILPQTIHCPEKKFRGKPYPDQIFDCLEKNKINKKDACFIGDTYIDYLAAKKANIGFIFAKYGYGIDKKIYKNKILKFKDISKYLVT